jgi:hypothetical protein
VKCAWNGKQIQVLCYWAWTMDTKMKTFLASFVELLESKVRSWLLLCRQYRCSSFQVSRLEQEMTLKLQRECMWQFQTPTSTGCKFASWPLMVTTMVHIMRLTRAQLFAWVWLPPEVNCTNQNRNGLVTRWTNKENWPNPSSVFQGGGGNVFLNCPVSL